MWLLGVAGAAAGLVAGIYLFEVLSSTLGSRSRDSGRNEALRRKEELERRWMDEENKAKGDPRGPVKSD
ncbi:MAG: hypothetical protein KJO98_07220 [Rhodothermia bacterium]|nr:hypothetical protein [Rhodothermia bacterium]